MYCFLSVVEGRQGRGLGDGKFCVHINRAAQHKREKL